MEGNFNNLFDYKIIYSNTRKKSVGFKIEENKLLVLSPKRLSKEFLLQLVEKRKLWTIKKLEKKKKYLINDKNIIFLGKELKLSINESNLLKNGGNCTLNNLDIIINISENWNKLLLENIIKSWYKKECLKIINERVLYFADKYKLNYGKITIKEQKTVWGTCNSKNDLTFNWKIILFETEVIDYLVVHELVHTIHKNHSNEYWKYVESILPNYKELNKKLK